MIRSTIAALLLLTVASGCHTSDAPDDRRSDSRGTREEVQVEGSCPTATGTGPYSLQVKSGSGDRQFEIVYNKRDGSRGVWKGRADAHAVEKTVHDYAGISEIALPGDVAVKSMAPLGTNGCLVTLGN
jgi:hypothetical protein